jgi:hypothetical protein
MASSSSLTVECWLQLGALSTGDGAFISNSVGTGANMVVVYRLGYVGDALQIVLFGRVLTTTQPVVGDVWTHVAVTLSATGSVLVYTDGLPVFESQVSASLVVRRVDAIGAFVLGTCYGTIVACPARPFVFAIGEVRLL